tara:strand:+ start:709 stop:1260 length:552 start_codon:yes stop_codon:yes gene_type:complete
MIETIVTYDNVVSPTLCDRIIHVVKKGLDMFSLDMNIKKTGILLNEYGDTGQELSQVCLNSIHEKTVDYLNRYPSLELKPEDIYCSNFFVTGSSAATLMDKYYMHDQEILSRNIVSWYLFLSDSNEDNVGGEIEFPMFNKRINPSKGRLVLFPNGISYIYHMLSTIKGSTYKASGRMSILPIH